MEVSRAKGMIGREELEGKRSRMGLRKRGGEVRRLG